jgi:hypothetical protein
MDFRKLLCLFMAFTLLLLSGCALPQASDPTDESTQPSETTEPTEPERDWVSVLFVGDSFTELNDMPAGIFAKMAEEAGYDVRIFLATKSGYTLTKFTTPGNQYAEELDLALSENNAYDYVVLQDGATHPTASGGADFYGAVRNLARKIRSAGAKPILYSTWGYKEGHETLKKNQWTNESMTWRVTAAYRAIGHELGIDVAYAGLAFMDVNKKYSMIDLYGKNLSNPSYAGSYLAAATLFATIFNEDPITAITFTGDLTERQAEVLLDAAWDAVFDTPEVPREYKISSAGIGEK